MTDDIRHFQPSIPAGTPPTALHAVPMIMPVMRIEQVDWKVPPGHGGLVGWFLAMGDVQVRPLPIGAFMVHDNKDGVWAGGGMPDSGTWQLVGYNTGIYPHSVWLTFHLALIRKPAPRFTVIPASQLGPAPDLSHAGRPTGII